MELAAGIVQITIRVRNASRKLFILKMISFSRYGLPLVTRTVRVIALAFESTWLGSRPLQDSPVRPERVIKAGGWLDDLGSGHRGAMFCGMIAPQKCDRLCRKTGEGGARSVAGCIGYEESGRETFRPYHSMPRRSSRWFSRCLRNGITGKTVSVFQTSSIRADQQNDCTRRQCATSSISSDLQRLRPGTHSLGNKYATRRLVASECLLMKSTSSRLSGRRPARSPWGGRRQVLMFNPLIP